MGGMEDMETSSGIRAPPPPEYKEGDRGPRTPSNRGGGVSKGRKGRPPYKAKKSTKGPQYNQYQQSPVNYPQNNSGRAQASGTNKGNRNNRPPHTPRNYHNQYSQGKLDMDYTGRYEDPSIRRPYWNEQQGDSWNSPIPPWRYEVPVENRYYPLRERYDSDREGEYFRNNYEENRNPIPEPYREPPNVAPLRNKPESFFREKSKQKRKTKRGCRGGKQITQKKKEVDNGGIFNLSGITLTETEQKTLNLGLKFAPKQSLNKFQMFTDLQK